MPPAPSRARNWNSPTAGGSFAESASIPAPKTPGETARRHYPHSSRTVGTYANSWTTRTSGTGRPAGQENSGRPDAALVMAGSRPGLGRQLVEGDVQREHVHPGLAEEAERPALDVAVDQGPDLRRGQVPGRGDA